jgi:hypothetical protein
MKSSNENRIGRYFIDQIQDPLSLRRPILLVIPHLQLLKRIAKQWETGNRAHTPSGHICPLSFSRKRAGRLQTNGLAVDYCLILNIYKLIQLSQYQAVNIFITRAMVCFLEFLFALCNSVQSHYNIFESNYFELMNSEQFSLLLNKL